MKNLIRDSKGRFLKGSIGFWKGKHLTEESIMKRTKSREGWKQSEESKNKIRANAKINPNFGMTGKKHREESIEKMKETHLRNGDNIKASERMRLNSPTKNILIAKKVGETLRIKYSIEKHPLCGRKQLKEEIDKRVLTWKLNNQDVKQSERMKNNNPMKNKEIIEKRRQNVLNNPKLRMMYSNLLKETRKNQIIPKYDTSIEVKIQNFLKQLNIDFFTHQYIKEIEHGYQCDILIPSMNLVIECDGNYWHKYPVGKDLDHIRTKELIEKGFKVLRLWEFEIKEMTIDRFKQKLELI